MYIIIQPYDTTSMPLLSYPVIKAVHVSDCIMCGCRVDSSINLSSLYLVCNLNISDKDCNALHLKLSTINCINLMYSTATKVQSDRTLIDKIHINFAKKGYS